MSKLVHYEPNSKKMVRQAGRDAKKKEGKKKRKAWDATTSDLSVHKLSKEEVVSESLSSQSISDWKPLPFLNEKRTRQYRVPNERRHRSHQSKNAELAKHDLYEKAKENIDLNISGNLRPSLTPLATRGGSLLRPVKEKEIHDILAESDKALRVVKDMFGDDPMRYTCQPNITVAPHIVKDKASFERTLQESYRDGPPPTAIASPGGIKDESIQELAPKKPALNELPNIQSTGSDEDDLSGNSLFPSNTITPQGRRYKPSLDLKRFQELIAKEERADMTGNDGLKSSQSTMQKPQTKSGNQPLVESVDFSENVKKVHPSVSKARPTLDVHLPLANVDDASLSGLSDISSIPGNHLEGGREDLTRELDLAINVQKKVPLTRPAVHPLHMVHKVTSDSKATHSMEGNLEELETVLQNLPNELQELEQSSTSLPTTVPTTKLTNIVHTILAAVTKLTHYICESEAQLKGEVEVRGHLLQTMTEQQNLMDALTTDVVKLQKEKSEVKQSLNEIKQTTSEQLLSMQKEISELHKKFSSFAIKSFSPALAWTNSQLVPSPQLSPPVSSVRVAPMSKNPSLESTNQELTTNGTSESFHHTAQQVPINSSSLLVHSPYKLPPVISQNTLSPHITKSQRLDQSGHSKRPSPFIQAQMSPLIYNVTGSLDSHSNLSTFSSDRDERKVSDSSSLKELMPIGDSFTGDSSSEYLLHATSDAPLPPPLSIALQVPTLSNSATNTALSVVTHTSAGGSVNVNSSPKFDVTGLLNSLVDVKNMDSRNDSLLLSTENTGVLSSSSSLTGTHSLTTVTSCPLLPTSSTTVCQSQKHLTQTIDVSEPILSGNLGPSQEGLQAPDLSVSAFSTTTEEIPVSKEYQNHHEMSKKNQLMMGHTLLHLEQKPQNKNLNGWFSLASHVSDS